jgi:multiple sugar transport system substrate-binding protein
MYTWGWAFGGSFFDYKRQRVTATDAPVVSALEWMCSYAEKYDVTKIASLQQGFGSAEQNPFYTGKVSMMCLHIGGIAEIERYAPDLDYGVGFIPAPPHGEPQSSWVGGWCVGIARGARHQEAAWRFIQWLCHSDEGTALVGRETGLFPGRPDSPHFAAVVDKPHYGDFVRILEACKHQRPVMPVQAFYMRQLQRAVDAAIYGKRTSAQAMADAEQKTQAELELVRAGRPPARNARARNGRRTVRIAQRTHPHRRAEWRLPMAPTPLMTATAGPSQAGVGW